MPERDHSGRTACSSAAWAFSRAEELWSRFTPLTPYGKDAKERREALADRGELERIYDRTEEAAAFLSAAGGGVSDRVAYHLKRLPRLPFSAQDLESGAPGEGDGPRLGLELIEIFEVKKFVANYRGILRLLDRPTRESFGLDFRSEGLAARLDLGGSDAETFFVADAYHPELPALRAAIARKDASLREARGAAKARSRLERGLDFAERDFLVVDKARAAALLAPAGEPGRREGADCAESGYPGPLYSVEAYDGDSCVVRIQDDPATLALDEERRELAARERELESEVLSSLSAAVALEAARLLGYAEAICEFDLARARAVLAAELGCARPELGSAALVLEQGRFLPCESDCASLGLEYTPLGARIEEGTAVLFGSNMGGKTVALQTLLFFQAMAQAGLFVPAARFATSVYARLDYVGELRSSHRGGAAAREGGAESQGGLSGFGFEIRSFAEAWEAALSRGAFVVMDEFARTTSSAEAEAILSAAIAALSSAAGTRAVLSTHFRGVARIAGVRYLEMRGLDRRAAGEAMLSGEAVSERIRRINRMMRYEIVEADESRGSSDAIVIASLLGLDRGIAEKAAALYAERSELGAARGKST